MQVPEAPDRPPPMSARVQGAVTEALLRVADAGLGFLVTSSRGPTSQCPANHETIPTPRQSTIKPLGG
jgi:hypothetical protein